MRPYKTCARGRRPFNPPPHAAGQVQINCELYYDFLLNLAASLNIVNGKVDQN